MAYHYLQAFAYNQPGGVDPFLVNMAGNMLQQSGSNYLQKGQAFMQSKMGFLSGGLLHYHFSITGDYGECKACVHLVEPNLYSGKVTGRLVAHIDCQASGAPIIYTAFCDRLTEI